jgi:hypothetical protein
MKDLAGDEIYQRSPDERSALPGAYELFARDSEEKFQEIAVQIGKALFILRRW